MYARQDKRIFSNQLLIPVAGGLLFLAACSDGNESWYDESKGYDQQRKDRVDAYIGQGMAETQALREVDLESAIRMTERGVGVPPLEGSDLKNALRQDEAARK